MDLLYYLIIPFLLLWSLFLPIWTFFALKRNQNLTGMSPTEPEIASPRHFKVVPAGADLKLGEDTATINENLMNNNPYSFITDGYDNHTYYWEFVIMGQKMLVIISITFIHDSNALLCLFLFLLPTNNPLLHSTVNKLSLPMCN